MSEQYANRRCLIVGCGYLGSRVARCWQDAGAHVTILTRSTTKSDQFRNHGYQTLVADLACPETLRALPEADIVLYSVGFDRTSGNTIHQAFAEGMGYLLSHLPTPASTRLIYISTTGVYSPAESSGTEETQPQKAWPLSDWPLSDWIDEQQPTHPHRVSAQASLAAERQLDSHALGQQAVILRMAGLYGPGRIPYQKELRAGLPLAVPHQGWLNLVHVDDAAATVLAAGEWPARISQGPEIINVADGNPVLRGDYYREVARRIGAPPPRFTTPDASLPATARASSSKRISNEKLRHLLKVKFTHPSYREGLAAILGP